ncbi:UNVERIFIED_CONTAM: hypothetical protein Sradi_4604800 [Sesamum radiatum]|uniref:Bet v I/Major latex protein domain-containing protein n=1 Tax=Sesamum radiatum TaxID=300843 RepID=A0AAW2NBG5_SESRA
MEGSISMKLEVNASASEIWKAYGSLQLPKIIMDTFPDKYSELKVLKGDGHSGTVVEVYFAPGMCAGADMVQGGVRGGGRCETIQVSEDAEGRGFGAGVQKLRDDIDCDRGGKPNTCIMTGTVDYVLDDIDSGLQVLSGAIGAFYQIMKAVADYVIKQQEDTTTN